MLLRFRYRDQLMRGEPILGWALLVCADALRQLLELNFQQDPVFGYMEDAT